MNGDRVLVSSGEDSGRPCERRCPDVAIDVCGGEDSEGVLSKKGDHGQRNRVTVLAFQIAGLFANAHAFLDGEFAGMEW